jgi:hypothetical protein
MPVVLASPLAPLSGSSECVCVCVCVCGRGRGNELQFLLHLFPHCFLLLFAVLRTLFRLLLRTLLRLLLRTLFRLLLRTLDHPYRVDASGPCSFVNTYKKYQKLVYVI